MKIPAHPKTRGRPPAFDREKALTAAMHEFWQHGFEGTSVSSLSEAMGLNPPSIYGAFGDKRQLFAEAVKAYLAGPGAFGAELPLGTDAPRMVLFNMLMRAAESFTRKGTPRGCMVVISGLNCTEESEDMSAMLTNLRKRSREIILAFVQDAHARGHLPVSMNPKVFADFISSVLQGMSIMARDGASRQDLQATVRQAMDIWPAPKG